MAADGEDGKRFFIAHSWRQKDFALALREALKQDAWVDLHEIDVGDILLDKIAAGIAAASDFVLLWTHDSANSSWVRYESHMAFIRYLEDSAINIRVVCLDGTTVPLHLRPLLQARDLTDPNDIAGVLLGGPPVRRTLRPFVNRNIEIGALEEVLYSGERGVMWYFGVAGVGKRALAREALRRLSADASRTARVPVRRGTGFVELHLTVCEALGEALPEDALSEREAREAAMALIAAFAADGGIWLFEEAHHWLDEEASPSVVLEGILQSLEASGVVQPEHGAIFTATRRPSLDEPYATVAEVRRVRGLASGFAVALLRGHGADGSIEDLRTAAAQLAGHPLALELTIGALKGPSSIDWEAERVSTAQAMLVELSLDEPAETLLEALAAVDGPLPAEQFAAHLSLTSDAFSRAVGEASSYALVEERGGFLRIHPLIRDFYLRVLRRRGDFRDRITDLADRSRDFLHGTSPASTVRVDSLLTTFRLLSWSGRLEEAFELHRTLFSTLLETAIDLYNERRYEAALRYFEAVIESTEDNVRAKLYAARTLAHLDRADEARTMMDELLAVSPDDVELLRIRGRVEFILRSWHSALHFFEHARQRRPNSVAVLRDLGQVNIRLEQWEAARESLERAMAVREPGAFVHFYYSQVLEHFGELERARSVIEAAIKVDPESPGFHHRLGRIALRQDDNNVARREFEHALKLSPHFHEAGISLASLLVDTGELTAARGLIERVERMPGVRPALLATIKAKLSLGEGDCEAARAFVQAALAQEREPESLSLALRVEFHCFRQESDSADRLRAKVEPLLGDLRARGLKREEDRWRAQLNEILQS